MRRDVGLRNQAGAIDPFGILGWVRRFVPFTHGFRANQKDGRGQQIQINFSTTGATDATIALGHQPAGFIPVGQTASASVFATISDQAAWTPNNIRLRVSAAPVIVNLWVF